MLLLAVNACEPVEELVQGMAAPEPASAIYYNAAADLLQPGFSQSLLGNINGQTRAWGLCMADFNGDGKADILCSSTSGNVCIYISSGSGTFTRSVFSWKLPYGGVYALAAGDINNDGKQDFVMACAMNSPSTAPYSLVDGGIYVYYGNGDGTFQGTTYLVSGVVHLAGTLIGNVGSKPMSVAVADVDNDGDLDVVASDITASANNAADIILFKQGKQGPTVTWTPSTIVSAANQSTIDPNIAPYYPPTSWTGGYGPGLRRR